MRTPVGIALLGALSAGCLDGTVGTIRLGLVTAPGSPLLDTVTRLRVTLTDPRQVMEATRTDAGFDLALEVEADGEAGSIIVEGFDAGAVLVATGSSPPFTSNPIDSAITVYVAPPLSIQQAPVSLSSARADLAVNALAYGGIFVGGTLGDSTASTAVEIYNAYDHSLTAGLPLPEPRAHPGLAATTAGVVYIAGGNPAVHTVRLFDTTIAPSGAYGILAESDVVGPPGTAIALGDTSILVAAAAPYVIDATAITARPDLPALHGGAAVTTTSGERVALVGTPDGVARFRAGALSPLPTPGATPLPVAAITALADGSFVVVASDRTDVYRIAADTGAVTTSPGALSELRAPTSIAATARYVVIASGTSADVLDATTLARVATLPTTVGRAALALPDDQILLGGALDGAATARLDLFTPPPPPL